MEPHPIFAQVNDSMRWLLGSECPEGQSWEFICECTDVTCHSVVSLTLNEFDERRAASPRLPILATEHAC
jgi:hypothetical protein